MFIFWFVGYAVYASAQVTISGQVRAQSSGVGVSDVNVMLQNEKHTVLYGYAISDADGNNVKRQLCTFFGYCNYRL